MSFYWFSLFTFICLPDMFYISAAAAAKSLQSCSILCDPIDGSLPGSPVPGILQARTPEWVAISFSNAWKWKVKVKSLSHVRLAKFIFPSGLGSFDLCSIFFHLIGWKRGGIRYRVISKIQLITVISHRRVNTNRKLFLKITLFQVRLFWSFKKQRLDVWKE